MYFIENIKHFIGVIVKLFYIHRPKSKLVTTVIPTFEPCANFGHNFYRETASSNEGDSVKCKHCKLEVRINSNGDFEEIRDKKLEIHQMMKKLFVLRSAQSRFTKRQVFGYGNI